MKSNTLLMVMIFFLGISSLSAQQKTSMSLRDAVSLSLEKSDEVGLANTKVATKGYELSTVKNNQYPDFKIAAQYLRLTNAEITQKGGGNPSGGTEIPHVNQLLLGQANMNLPVFAGFRLKNNVAVSSQLYQAEKANAIYTQEEIAIRVIQYYADLYKSQKAVELLKENIKSSQQRVSDFKAMEENGLIARNDLLKAQLQVSKVQLSLDEAEKNVRMVNYYLVQLLKLSPETIIEVSPENIDKNLFENKLYSEDEALENRKDLEAVHFLEKASESGIKVARSGYFPTIGLVAGYVALDLHNFVTVANALDFGVGLNYNLASIFKNGKEVKAAKSRAMETQKQALILTDNIKSQIVNANEEYQLSLKQEKVYDESVTQANENFRIVKDKFDNGLSDTNDLLEADLQYLSTQINQADAKANVALQYYELLNTSGQLLKSFNFSKN